MLEKGRSECGFDGRVNDRSVVATLTFPHRHKAFELKLTEDGAIELYLDNCLRKRREASEKEPQYVWTNVELEWEEHHYIEVRYWKSDDRLLITVNGDELLERCPWVAG